MNRRAGAADTGASGVRPLKAALAISMVLRPPAAQLARINMIGALSVYDLAKQVGCKGIGLKWPNDIQVGGRKIAGILAESVWERDNLRGAVLGIGVNVRIDFSHTELRDAAASLEEVAGVPLDRAELIRVLLERISVWYERSASDEVFDTWKSRLSMLGKPVIAEGVSGIALDVTDSGALLVEDDLGVRHIVIAGEVTTGGVLRSAE